MPVKHAIQKSASDFSMIIGTGLKYGGAFGLLTMAVVGTISVDLVLLAKADKDRNPFLTGFVLGSMFSQGNPDPVPLLIASPITSAVAVVLSVALGVPSVGAAILAGWVLAVTTLAVGIGLQDLAKAINPDNLNEEHSSFCCN